MPSFKGYDADDLDFGVEIEEKDPHKFDRRAERERRKKKSFDDKAEEPVPQRQRKFYR